MKPLNQNRMKVTIEFDGIEEFDDINDALNGYKWKSVVWDLDQELRRYLKYDDTIDEKTYDVVEKIRGFLRESVHDNGVSLND
jgi:hypothetical protein